MRPRRDKVLGAALRSLEVPEHTPDFFPRLTQALESEPRQLPGAGLHRPRRAGATWRPLSFAAGVALVVVAAFVASVIIPGSPPGGPPGRRPGLGGVASAAEVRSRVAQATAAAQNVRGELTSTCGPAPMGYCAAGQTLRWSFLITAEGDQRVVGIGRADEQSYDAQRGIVRQVFAGAASEMTGLPTGPPDPPLFDSVVDRTLGSSVRAFLATSAPVPVSEVVHDGRPAWHMVTPVEPNRLSPDTTADTLDVTVDRESGYPLEVIQLRRGHLLQEVSLSKVVLNGPAPDPSALFPAFVPEVHPVTSDAGFTRVRPDQVAAVVGYQPLLPAGLPPGFRLAQLAVSRTGQPTGKEGSNPPSAGIVSAAYRRGFDSVVVTSRVTGPSAQAWTDPLSGVEGSRDPAEPVVLRQGSQVGQRATLVLGAQSLPHIWTVGPRLVITIGGDLGRSELLRAMESL